MIFSPSTKFVPKSWGFEKWLVNNDLYCGKILCFMKHHKCSLHYHKLKDETFYVQNGHIVMLYSDYIGGLERDKDKVSEAVTWIDENSLSKYGIFHSGFMIRYELLSSGDVFHIPQNLAHMVFALEDSTIIEISTHHEDSDSYRIVLGY